MCLHLTKDSEHGIAEHDIIVYKFLRQRKDNGQLYSPFRLMPYQVGQMYYSNLEYIPGTFSSDGIVVAPTVEEGLHCYVHEKDVMRLVTDDLTTMNIVAAECVIPKGATYYTGLYGQQEAIASNQLKVIRILGEKEENVS